MFNLYQFERNQSQTENDERRNLNSQLQIKRQKEKNLELSDAYRVRVGKFMKKLIQNNNIQLPTSPSQRQINTSEQENFSNKKKNEFNQTMKDSNNKFNFYNNTITNETSINFSSKSKNLESKSLAEIKIFNRLNSNTNQIYMQLKNKKLNIIQKNANNNNMQRSLINIKQDLDQSYKVQTINNDLINKDTQYSNNSFRQSLQEFGINILSRSGFKHQNDEKLKRSSQIKIINQSQNDPQLRTNDGMRFKSTQAERVQEAVIQNQYLESNPSQLHQGKTMETIMNLRPTQNQKHLAGNFHFQRNSIDKIKNNHQIINIQKNVQIFNKYLDKKNQKIYRYNLTNAANLNEDKKKELKLNLNLKNNPFLMHNSKEVFPKINEKTFYKAALEYSLGQSASQRSIFDKNQIIEKVILNQKKIKEVEIQIQKSSEMQSKDEDKQKEESQLKYRRKGVQASELKAQYFREKKRRMQNQSLSSKDENNGNKGQLMFMTAPNDNYLNESEALDHLINSFDDRELQLNIQQNLEVQVLNKVNNSQFKSKTIYSGADDRSKKINKKSISSQLSQQSQNAKEKMDKEIEVQNSGFQISNQQQEEIKMKALNALRSSQYIRNKNQSILILQPRSGQNHIVLKRFENQIKFGDKQDQFNIQTVQNKNQQAKDEQDISKNEYFKYKNIKIKKY